MHSLGWQNVHPNSITEDIYRLSIQNPPRPSRHDLFGPINMVSANPSGRSRCKQCTMTGKNLKSIIPRNKHTSIPTLSEPNEEIKMDFAGPITNNNKDTFKLVTIERYSR